jgi:hypothetical protein
LEEAFDEIVRRHESLRTTFTIINGRPVQIIHEPRHFDLPLINLTELSGADRRPESRQIIINLSERPFDLRTGPLMRIVLFQFGAEEHHLLVVMHHIISDGWSVGSLIREAALLYKSLSSGEPAPLRELPIQYVDYVEWQRNWLLDEKLNSMRDYWLRRLGGKIQRLGLPADRPRSKDGARRGARHRFLVPTELAGSLQALSRKEDVTLFMTLLAAFNTLLYRYTGQEQITVGSPIANRARPETEELIGFFVNMLVLRVDLQNNQTFSELLSQVRQVTLEAYAHQDYPFEMLVEALEQERSLDRSPLFQVVFAFQNVPRSEPKISGLIIEPLEVDFGMTMYDFILGMASTDEGIEGSITYSTALFDHHTIINIANHFQTLLAEVAANPEISLLDIPFGKEVKEPLFKQNSVLQRKYMVEHFNF